jgi:hypothetical protein
LPFIRVHPCFIRGSTFAIPALVCLTVAGCTPDSGRYTVAGKVAYQGKPVAEGTITFEDPVAGQVNSATLGAGGVYLVELPAGDFRVSVSPPLVETKAGADSPGDMVPKPVANIPKKYWVQEKSGLSAKVERDKRIFDFELKP